MFYRLAATALEVMIEALSTDALSSVMADNFRFPEGVLNITADWLIMQQDRTSGIFWETGTVHNRIYLVRFYSGTTNEIMGDNIFCVHTKCNKYNDESCLSTVTVWLTLNIYLRM